MNKEQREAIRVRLAELEFSNGGRLTPSAVVEDAKDPDAPTHHCFEWDDNKAAESYRIEQARTLITSVVVMQRTEHKMVSCVYYARDPSCESHEQGYVSVPTLRTDADMAREVLHREFSSVADSLRRARTFAAVLDATDVVETLLSSVVGLRQRFEQPPATGQ